MRLYSRYAVLVLWFIFLMILGSGAHAYLPVPTDSRIKTFVYNENDVFHIVVHYGYQSSIEFAKNEEIEAISMGNSFSWKYSNVGRRLFLTALEGSSHTNMTVITNKRTYQFDLESRDPADGVDDELIYVVRFYYPDANFSKSTARVDTKKFMPEALVSSNKYNFSYSLTGPDSIAPIKVFDDGKSTYLKFKNNNADVPNIFIVSADGNEERAKYAREGEYIVIKRILDKISLRLNQDVVYVFNDNRFGAAVSTGKGGY